MWKKIFQKIQSDLYKRKRRTAHVTPDYHFQDGVFTWRSKNQTANHKREGFQVLTRLIAQLKELPPLDYPHQNFLSKHTRKVMRKAAATLFFDGEQGPTQEQLDWFELEIDDMLASSAGVSRIVMHLIPWLLECSPVLTFSQFKLLTQLEYEDRLKCLQKLEDHPIKELSLIFFLSKTIMCMIYFEHPDAVHLTGYDGNCRQKPPLH